MDLKTLHIAGYKNLGDTRLTFETSEAPITIIGNNGTGKSNLIEAPSDNTGMGFVINTEAYQARVVRWRFAYLTYAEFEGQVGRKGRRRLPTIRGVICDRH